MPTKPNTMTMRVSDELKGKLDRYAQLTGRSMSHVAVSAVEQYLAWRIPQIEELGERVKEADAEKFATPEEVDAVFNTHGR
jgi:RHH-type transcriptional regulator, rel operon repressor / antitoxin RelB